jgi:hypothetical protein
MWSLAFRAAQIAARGVTAFANSDTGHKLGEKTSELIDSAREKIAESKDAYSSAQSTSGSSNSRLRPGQTVVVKNSGQVGTVVRYLLEYELGGSPSNKSETRLVLLDLLQHSSELDRYLFTSDSGCQVIS